MDWPPKSPDFNPIEHICQILKMKISRRLEPQHTFRELRAFMTEEWQKLLMNVINKCIRSMNKRARQAVEHRGSYTDYQELNILDYLDRNKIMLNVSFFFRDVSIPTPFFHKKSLRAEKMSHTSIDSIYSDPVSTIIKRLPACMYA